MLEALGTQLGVPSTRVNSYTVNPDAVGCLSEKVARKHTAFPLLKAGSTLVVAIASPKDLHALDDLRFASGCSIQMMVAMETEIQAALDKYYGSAFGPSDAEEVDTVVIDIPGPKLDLHDEVAERSASCRRCTPTVPSPPSPGSSRWDGSRISWRPPSPVSWRNDSCDESANGARSPFQPRGLMHDRSSEVELTEVARRTGFISLRDTCLARVADGTTTLEEVIRVTMAGRDNDGDDAAGPPAPPSA